MNEATKKLLMDDKKRGKIKQLCAYFKDKPELTKYKVFSNKTVNLMHEIKLLSSGLTLTQLDKIIEEYEGNLKISKGGKWK
jgi:DNA-binding transcriptional MerR regulator